eukprot:6189745-Pleurochrysis_carterae.AAC.2
MTTTRKPVVLLQKSSLRNVYATPHALAKYFMPLSPRATQERTPASLRLAGTYRMLPVHAALGVWGTCLACEGGRVRDRWSPEDSAWVRVVHRRTVGNAFTSCGRQTAQNWPKIYAELASIGSETSIC